MRFPKKSEKKSVFFFWFSLKIMEIPFRPITPPGHQQGGDPTPPTRTRKSLYMAILCGKKCFDVGIHFSLVFLFNHHQPQELDLHTQWNNLRSNLLLIFIISVLFFFAISHRITLVLEVSKNDLKKKNRFFKLFSHDFHWISWKLHLGRLHPQDTPRGVTLPNKPA